MRNFYNVYSLLNTVRVTKSRLVRLAEIVAWGSTKLEEERLRRSPRRRRQNNIKVDLREIRF